MLHPGCDVVYSAWFLERVRAGRAAGRGEEAAQVAGQVADCCAVSAAAGAEAAVAAYLALAAQADAGIKCALCRQYIEMYTDLNG